MGRTLKFLTDLVNHMCELVRERARTKLAQRLDLRFDIRRVTRELRQQRANLPGHDPAQTHQKKTRRRNGQKYREQPFKASSFQRSNNRVQQERQQNRQGDRNQNGTPPLQTNDNNKSHKCPRKDNQSALPDGCSASSDHDLLDFVIGLTARQSILRSN